MKKLITLCAFLFLGLGMTMGNSQEVAHAEDTSMNTTVVSPTPNPGIYNMWDDTTDIHTEGIYTYQNVALLGGCVIQKIDADVETLTIPSSLGGQKVVGIGRTTVINNRFYDIVNPCENVMGTHKDSLKNLIIPEGVTYVGVSAFELCNNLESIEFSKSVNKIEECAFSQCKKLKEVILPQGASLNNFSFRDCGTLDKVIVNDNVFMGDTTPFALTSIKEFVIAKTSKKVNVDFVTFSESSIDSVRIAKRIKEVTLYNLGRQAKRLIVEDKATRIKTKSTQNKTGKTKIVLCTMPGATCIKWAKSNKLNYKTMALDKVGTVKKKQSKYSWKKAKTSITAYTYSKGWKSITQSKKTVYEVYGKNQKKENYKLLGETTKTNYKSSCKYVKVAIKGW